MSSSAVNLWLAFYQHWPMDTTIVGVYSNRELAQQGLDRSLKPPETDGVIVQFELDGDNEYNIDGG